MATTVTNKAKAVNFRPTPEDAGGLEHIRARLSAQAPAGMKRVTVADVLRYAIATAGSAVPPASPDETLFDSNVTGR